LKPVCRVPQDISVTGFEQYAIAENSNPSITTVDVHRDMLGKDGRPTRFHELSRSADPRGREYQFLPSLILGDSSGPLPQNRHSLIE